MRDWLKARRDAMNKTQDEIAELSGITRPAYNMIENGVRRPSVPVAKRIGNAMSIDWTIFFADEGNETTRSKEAAR